MNERLKAFRRDLHAHPELSGHERETQARIKRILETSGAPSPQDVGRFGTMYTFDFGGAPHVLIRVDIDALPIQEINDFAHKSTVAGISHKCGHDGHAAIGVGLVQRLVEEPHSSGKVTVLFQPAEEIGEGARGILEDKRFDPSRYDFAIALHNIPGEAHHKVLWKVGGFTPAVHSLVIKLHGKTSHAAQPLKGHNPSYAISEIIQQALELEETDEKHPNYGLITPVYTHVGSKDYGISAGYGEVHFTIRSWEQAKMEALTERFLASVRGIAQGHHLKLGTEIVAEFAANLNKERVVSAIREASDVLGLQSDQRTEPFPWGEDFGLFTQHIDGAMFGLGSGVDTPALHNPDYDYPDEITETGVNIFYETIKSLIDDV